MSTARADQFANHGGMHAHIVGEISQAGAAAKAATGARNQVTPRYLQADSDRALASRSAGEQPPVIAAGRRMRSAATCIRRPGKD